MPHYEPISRVIYGLLSQSTGISLCKGSAVNASISSDNVVDLWNHNDDWNQDAKDIKKRAMNLVAANHKLNLPSKSLIPFFRKLRLDGHLVSQIDKTFLCFIHLKYLSLNSCGLTEIANLPPNIEFLSLNDNRLASTPDLTHLKGLVHLGLSRNSLSLINHNALPLSIQSLDISWNNLCDLSQLSSALSKMTNLAILTCLANPIALSNCYQYRIASCTTVKWLDEKVPNAVPSAESKELIRVKINRIKLCTVGKQSADPSIAFNYLVRFKLGSLIVETSKVDWNAEIQFPDDLKFELDISQHAVTSINGINMLTQRG